MYQTSLIILKQTSFLLQCFQKWGFIIEKKLLCKANEIHKSVYNKEREMNKLTDRRVNPSYKTVLLIKLVLFLLRIYFRDIYKHLII